MAVARRSNTAPRAKRWDVQLHLSLVGPSEERRQRAANFCRQLVPPEGRPASLHGAAQDTSLPWSQRANREECRGEKLNRYALIAAVFLVCKF